MPASKSQSPFDEPSAPGGKSMEFQRRLAFMELDESDAVRARELLDTFDDRGEQFAKQFYDHLLSFSETSRFLQDAELVRRLTDSPQAGLVAATAFTFCPYVQAHTAHIQLLMVFGIPLVFLAFHAFRDTPTLGRAAARVSPKLARVAITAGSPRVQRPQYCGMPHVRLVPGHAVGIPASAPSPCARRCVRPKRSSGRSAASAGNCTRPAQRARARRV